MSLKKIEIPTKIGGFNLHLPVMIMKRTPKSRKFNYESTLHLSIK